MSTKTGQLQFVHSPALRQAYELHEYLAHLFYMAPDRASTQQQLANWRFYVERTPAPGFERFLGTLQSWSEAIGNYFIARDRAVASSRDKCLPAPF